MNARPVTWRSTAADGGFLLPVLVLLLSLAGVLTLSVTASTLQSTRASAAALAQRQAFEVAENRLAAARREAAGRAAPWTAEGQTPEGVRWQLAVFPLGAWPTAPDGATAAPLEVHERAVVTAYAGRGALARLEQDYVRKSSSAMPPAIVAQPTVWREWSAEPVP